MLLGISAICALLFVSQVSAACSTILTRKEFRDLTNTERTAFMSVLTTLYATDKWLNLVNTHQKYKDMSHNHPAFLPWHRSFMLDFQDLVHSVNPAVTVPYYDFSIDSQAPAKAIIWQYFGSSLKGGCVPDGPFAGPNKCSYPTPHCLSRGFDPSGVGMSTLTTTETLGQITRTSADYTAFEQAIEYGYHAVLHNTVGGASGDMSQMYSPNDPLFFMHHMFVDKLWDDWSRVHTSLTYLPAADRNTTMLPRGLPISGLESTSALCYQYAQPGAGSSSASTSTSVSKTATTVSTTSEAVTVPAQTTTTKVTTTSKVTTTTAKTTALTTTASLSTTTVKGVTSVVTPTATAIGSSSALVITTTSLVTSTMSITTTYVTDGTTTSSSFASVVTTPVITTITTSSTIAATTTQTPVTSSESSSDSSSVNGDEGETTTDNTYLNYLLGLQYLVYNQNATASGETIGHATTVIDGQTYDTDLVIPVLPAPLSDEFIKNMMYIPERVRATEKLMNEVCANVTAQIHSGVFVGGPGASSTPGLPGTGSGSKASGSVYSPYPPTSKKLLVQNTPASPTSWNATNISTVLQKLASVASGLVSSNGSTSNESGATSGGAKLEAMVPFLLCTFGFILLL